MLSQFFSSETEQRFLSSRGFELEYCPFVTPRIRYGITMVVCWKTWFLALLRGSVIAGPVTFSAGSFGLGRQMVLALRHESARMSA